MIDRRIAVVDRNRDRFLRHIRPAFHHHFHFAHRQRDVAALLQCLQLPAEFLHLDEIHVFTALTLGFTVKEVIHQHRQRRSRWSGTAWPDDRFFNLSGIHPDDSSLQLNAVSAVLLSIHQPLLIRAGRQDRFAVVIQHPGAGLQLHRKILFQ